MENCAINLGKNRRSLEGVYAATCNRGPEIVPRDGWGARPPTKVEPMQNPVPFVVIHHSYIPAACYNEEDCITAMKWMQDYHQLNHSWNDIGYSFVSGGDNRIYTGRGWSSVGAHAPGYNNKSIGICLIGDWRAQVPPESQLTTVKQLIQKGIKEGFIQEDYKLVGHRQVKSTECPGDALFAEIQTWPHWVEDPNDDPVLLKTSQIIKEGLKPDPRENPSETNKLQRRHLLQS
ncbi:peptidoglycan-recognition protein LB-like isoform X2 [Anthonomus grandis grandis]|uniref:peptidoglycan-recognition protein LB-like isoform X2 n=1 Tax=Anthonomus grandis grandis TaxID=2921223 RepID=UPI0021667E4C|nr:peptidoglycan-recognition protein LB-like isoform X2 [Anthonomus grandis grandis]